MPEEFTPINTQAEFDAAMEPLLQQERDMLQGQITERDNTITERDETIKTLQNNITRMRAADKAGLPMEMANRLTGETEEEIQNDANQMAKLFGKHKAPPLRTAEVVEKNPQDAALRNMLRKLKGE